MDDEGKRNDEIRRGDKAKAILEDEVFAEAFDKIKSVYMNAWEQSTVGDSQGRERLWAMVAHLNDVKAHLTTVITTGNFSKKQLSDLEPEESLISRRKLQKWGIRV